LIKNQLSMMMIKKARWFSVEKEFEIDVQTVNGVILELENILKRIKDVVDVQDKNLLDVGETPTWTGMSASALREKYEQLSKNFPMIVYSLELYIRFLKKTVQDYELIDKAQTENMEEMKDQMDVNS